MTQTRDLCHHKNEPDTQKTKSGKSSATKFYRELASWEHVFTMTAVA
jgi:hypothetical protein